LALSRASNRTRAGDAKTGFSFRVSALSSPRITNMTVANKHDARDDPIA